MTATWHVDVSVLESYARGRSTPVGGASVEAHLMECRECGAVLRELVPREPLDQAWAAIRAHVEEPRAGAVERLLATLGLSSDPVRLLAAVPAFRGAWLLGVFTVLVFAGGAALLAEDTGLTLFLVIAPLIPVAGVAASFGGDADPAHELVTVTPYSSVRLLLLRTAGVLMTSVPITVLLGLALPGPAWLAVAWLTPAAAGIALTLAVSPYFDTTTTAAVISVVWTSAVLSAHHLGDPAE
ncbi:MAG TPA: hypothetical protein VFI19_06935, partial [Nocardioides sp.]|nr:hypothetical protein [Nocardioides sp.]